MNKNLIELAARTHNKGLKEAGTILTDALVYFSGERCYARCDGKDEVLYELIEYKHHQLCFFNNTLYHARGDRLDGKDLHVTAPLEKFLLHKDVDAMCCNGSKLYYADRNSVNELKPNRKTKVFESEKGAIRSIAASNTKIWFVTSSVPSSSNGLESVFYLNQYDLLKKEETMLLASPDCLGSLCYYGGHLYFSELGKVKQYCFTTIADFPEKNIKQLIELDTMLVARLAGGDVCAVNVSEKPFHILTGAEAICAVPKTYLQEKGFLK